MATGPMSCRGEACPERSCPIVLKMRRLPSSVRWALNETASKGPGWNDRVGSEVAIPIMPRSPRWTGVIGTWRSCSSRLIVMSSSLPALREVAAARWLDSTIRSPSTATTRSPTSRPARSAGSPGVTDRITG